MAKAKLSHSAAASLAFVRNLQNEETHSLVRKEVFAQVKAAFGIPEKHRIKVELDASKPNYLDIIRKTDGSSYELGADNRWVGSNGEAATPKRVERPVYLKVPMDSIREFAIEMADDGNAEVVEPYNIGSPTTPTVVRYDDANHLYVRVDGNDLAD